MAHRLNKRHYVIGIVVLAMAGYLVMKIIHGFKENAKAFAEDLPSSQSLSSQDSSLISHEYKYDFVVNEVLHSKVRNPVSLITFQEKFSIVIHEVELKEAHTLKDLVITKNEATSRSTGYTYNVVDNNLFQFQYKSGKPVQASNIILTYSGDSLKRIVDNDSIMSYHLLCENFTIQYSEDQPIDLFIKSDKRNKQISMDILFLRRAARKSCYVVIMAPNDADASIPEDLLYKIITGKS